jgi:hypothetical protein
VHDAGASKVDHAGGLGVGVGLDKEHAGRSAPGGEEATAPSPMHHDGVDKSSDDDGVDEVGFDLGACTGGQKDT